MGLILQSAGIFNPLKSVGVSTSHDQACAWFHSRILAKPNVVCCKPGTDIPPKMQREALFVCTLGDLPQATSTSAAQTTTLSAGVICPMWKCTILSPGAWQSDCWSFLLLLGFAIVNVC